MRKILITILLLNSLQLTAQNYSQESLINDYLSGRLLIINELAVADTDSSFFETMCKLKIVSREIINQELGKELYGTVGERGVTRFEIENTEKLKDQYVSIIDATVLKHFNQEDSLFYMMDGLPSHDMYNAIQILMNKKIEKIQILEKNQAMAIWGREGENGALIVNCDRETKLTINN
jgi:uncharacterized protein YnzC (UPF0291/DUF896 family)